MEYSPAEVQHQNLTEKLGSEAESLHATAIVRRLRVTNFTVTNGVLSLDISSVALPLTISCNQPLVFGTETITAIEYFRRVIERNDLIDAVLMPREGGVIPIRSFWIRIEYIGTPPPAGSYSKKDDGLFAMRAKAGEKAERVVTRLLRDGFGHVFPSDMCESPGYFEIRYINKKNRKPDRKCLACGMTIEIKKRNKDEYFRVSHSAVRPFSSENSSDGWHAFVFPDMKAHFIPNVAIAQALAQGRVTIGQDQYDSWADIDPAAVTESDPPRCSRRS